MNRRSAYTSYGGCRRFFQGRLQLLKQRQLVVFDSSGSRCVVLGSEGLYLWGLETCDCRRLTKRGRQPVGLGREYLVCRHILIVLVILI